MDLQTVQGSKRKDTKRCSMAPAAAAARGVRDNVPDVRMELCSQIANRKCHVANAAVGSC